MKTTGGFKSKPFFVWILLCLMIFAIEGRATEDEPEEMSTISKFIKKKRINAGYLIFGAQSFNLNNLNNFLESKGYPALNEQYPVLGIGGLLMLKKIVLNLEIVRTLSNTNTDDKRYFSSSRTKYSVLNCGYLLKSDKGLMYYPYVGFGMGRLYLRVRESESQSFDDITGTQKGSDSTVTHFLLNVGMGVDYFHKFKKKNHGKNNLVLGVRIGYLFSPFQNDWRVNHIPISNGPDTRINGPYIRFTIGLGGWIEKIIEKAI